MREFYVTELVACPDCNDGVVTYWKYDEYDHKSYPHDEDCQRCNGTGKVENRVSLAEALAVLQNTGS